MRMSTLPWGIVRHIIGQKSALFTLCEVSNLIAMGTCEACQYEVVRV